jgi:hypothetical protein
VGSQQTSEPSGDNDSTKQGAGASWKWKDWRWLVGIFAFWLVAGGGAHILAHSGGSANVAGFITMVVVVFFVFAAFTDRGGWGAGFRAAFWTNAAGLTVLHFSPSHLLAMHR